MTKGRNSLALVLVPGPFSGKTKTSIKHQISNLKPVTFLAWTLVHTDPDIQTSSEISILQQWDLYLYGYWMLCCPSLIMQSNQATMLTCISDFKTQRAVWQAQWGQKDSYVAFKSLSLCNFKPKYSSNSTSKSGNYAMLLQNDFGPIVAGDLASSFLGSPRKSYTNYNLWTFFSRSLHINSLRSYTMYVV